MLEDSPLDRTARIFTLKIRLIMADGGRSQPYIIIKFIRLSEFQAGKSEKRKLLKMSISPAIGGVVEAKQMQNQYFQDNDSLQLNSRPVTKAELADGKALSTFVQSFGVHGEDGSP
jgi:hypothetical protein